MYPKTYEQANSRAAEWRAMADEMQALAWQENPLWGEMAAMNMVRAEFWEDEAERLLSEEMADDPISLDEWYAEIGKNIAKERS